MYKTNKKNKIKVNSNNFITIWGAIEKHKLSPNLEIVFYLSISISCSIRINWKSNGCYLHNILKTKFRYFKIQNWYKKSKEVNSDNFCYCKVRRVMIIWGAIEKHMKSPNLKNVLFLSISISCSIGINWESNG